MAEQITHENWAGAGFFSRLFGALVRRASGIALLAAGTGLFYALLTHASLDPSFNNATPTAAQNGLGLPGAYISDIVLQAIGWGGFAFAVCLLIWGASLFFYHKKKSVLAEPKKIITSWRIGAGIFASLLASFITAALPIPATWPLATGLGGLFGDALYLPLQAQSVPAWASFLALVLATVLMLLAFGFAFGLRRVDVFATLDAAGLFWATLRVGLDRVISLFYPRETVQPKPHIATPGTSRKKAPPTRQHKKTRVATPKRKKTSTREAREKQLVMPFAGTAKPELPRLDLLNRALTRTTSIDEEALQQNAQLLETVLSDFGIKGQITHVQPGPVVTLYELEPAPGLKSSRVVSLSDDIARSMSAISCRVAVIPGRNVIGIELPNSKRETVFLRDLLASSLFERAKADLPLALGETIGGQPFIADLARMPHLLVAGTTGAGKSVGVNAMILSLLYRMGPDQCKFIMIDPKMLELSIYDGIPHLLSPVVTDPKKAVLALRWTVREMESRYQKMSKLGVRSVAGFNARIAEAAAKKEPLIRTVQTGYDKTTGEPVFESETLDLEPMPFIVVVIDEMADLMMVAGKDIEAAVQRLAQMARAAGIHVITATQRPSVDVITGTIKANFPTRISFQVTSKIDSRTILGEQGAEQLLGKGDMLFMAGGGRVRRLHGPFVSDDEVKDVVAFLKKQAPAHHIEEITAEPQDGSLDGDMGFGGSNSGDELFDKAVAIIMRDRKVSTSYLQRRMQIGYNRAATLIERLEDDGIISAANHAGKRTILMPDHDEDPHHDKL